MSEDRFVHDDAAYVLGALSADERAEYEAHLQTCDECMARVREIADLPALLGSVSMDEVVEGVPETLLPGLLKRARSDRRRRNWVTGGLAGLAAACLAALVIAVWPSNSATAPAPHAQAMAAVVASPIHATAVLAKRGWGTEIDVVCTYSGGTAPPADYIYGLSVIEKDGTPQQLGTWTLVPDKDTKFQTGTGLRRDQIAGIEITGPDGQTILRLTT